MSRYALAVLVCLAGPADAEPVHQLVIPGVSYHFSQRAEGWNAVHPGIGYRYAFDVDSALGATYTTKNSLNRPSLYVMADYTPFHYGPLALGGFVGVATGYVPPVRFIAGLLLQMRGAPVTHELRYGPKVHDPKGSAVLTYVAVVNF